MSDNQWLMIEVCQGWKTYALHCITNAQLLAATEMYVESAYKELCGKLAALRAF